MSIESDIKQRAFELGFDAAGITTADPIDPAQVDYYRRWIEGGNAGKMGYLYRNIEKRFAPAKLLPGAKSVICVALNYRPAKAELNQKQDIRIAHFAQYEDYHPFMKKRLFELAKFIGSAGVNSSPPAKGEYPEGGRGLNAKDGRAAKFKACVDSAPLAERALAQRAGLGFIGKNRMLIHPVLGGQILLGELITTLQLQPDEPLENRSCGDCGKCLLACPTGALDENGGFDARKCISYLTIENPLPPSGYSPLAGGELVNARAANYIFGCDECILACPHEINAPPRKNPDFQFHPEWQRLTHDQIQTMTEEEFVSIFAGSVFIRLGLKRLKRNIKACQKQSN